MQDVPIILDYQGSPFKGFAVPLSENSSPCPSAFDIILNKTFFGTLQCESDGWKMEPKRDQNLTDLLGSYITNYYVHSDDQVNQAGEPAAA